MPRSSLAALAAATRIERQIHLLRGQRVMLDSSLAALYLVTTGNLNLAVRRNRGRFPSDFMFQLTKAEAENLILQTARSSGTWGGRRRSCPHAFTELGVAMLSSVLKSERAVRMNILVMRAFVRLRDLVAQDQNLRARVERLESGQRHMASVLEDLADAIAGTTATPPRKIGFSAGAR